MAKGPTSEGTANKKDREIDDINMLCIEFACNIKRRSKSD